jgi:CHAT domain-containing protein
MQARLPNAEFAFLSACHSAAGDNLGTPNEVIHLAAAMQFCGFRSIVGTLWAMEDVDGQDIAQDFYCTISFNSDAL